MDQTQENSIKNRRRSNRVEAPDLFISVKRKRWLVFEEYVDVETMDINRGGVGFIASDLNLKLLENVRLHFDFEDSEYFIGGIVVYKYEREGLEFYGIMFTQIPHQFESMLETLLEKAAEADEDDAVDMSVYEKTQKIDIAEIIKSRQIKRSRRLGKAAVDDARKASTHLKKVVDAQREKLDQVSADLNESRTIPDTQRRVDVRYPAGALGVRVRSRGLASFVDFVATEPGDISFGGLSFSVPASEPRLDEKVRLELKYKNMVLRASGMVSYIKQENDGTSYGVQFTMVPTKMKSLIRIMAADPGSDDQAAVK